MNLGLIMTLLGLAILDSANTSTLSMVIIILIAAHRPAATGWAYAIGAFLSFLTFALLIYFGTSSASAEFANFSLWMRRIIFTILAIVLAVFGFRRLKARERKGLPKLPDWVNPWTGIFFGALATIGDLPNAFPLFLAIDRLVGAAIPASLAVPTLIVYAFIYALPTFLLLVIGLIFRERVMNWLERVLERFTTGTSKASWKIASLFFAGTAICLYISIIV